MPVAAASETQEFAARQTRRLSRQLAVQINRALKSCDARAVHQVRVAIRRFNQGVAVCKPCFPAKDLRKCRRRLKKIMSAAGEVRNCDVADKLLDRWSLPHADRLRLKLTIRREEAARDLVAELKRWTDRRLTAQDSPGTNLHEMAQHAVNRIAEDFLERGNEAASAKASPHDMHRFRIVAKKFRYTLELFQPLNSLVERTKRVGALLGDINDCVTAAALVPPLASHLKKRQHKKTEEFRQYWASEFAKPTRKPVVSALTSRRKSAA
jgi:CHAD domain-containing protein